MDGTWQSGIVSADKKHVWHPYTPMQQYIESATPLVIERAEGSRIFDAQGRGYLDGNASWWVALLGHRHPRLVEALKRQAEKMCHVALAGIVHEPAARLAEELVAVAPRGLEHVFYSDDGSTAVEVALKMALQYWFNHGRPEKRRFVALDGAFHGDTLGATGVGGVDVFRRPFASVVLECVHVPSPGAEEGFEKAFAAMTQLIQGEGDSIAAVIVEPLLQGAAGMRVYREQYLQDLRALCTKHDVLLIVDEVFTGYGRCGQMWACDVAGIVPDILCSAKGFTGGILPMAVTLATARIFEAFLGDKDRALYYGHTYCGHPLGAAVAREVLAVYRDEDIVAASQPKSLRLQQTFQALAALPGVRRARHIGMAAAIDLEGDEGYLANEGWRVYEQALQRGAYLRPLGNTVYVTPPLNIPDADLEELLDIVESSVKAVLSSGSTDSK